LILRITGLTADDWCSRRSLQNVSIQSVQWDCNKPIVFKVFFYKTVSLAAVARSLCDS